MDSASDHHIRPYVAFIHLYLAFSPPGSVADDVTRSGLIYHLFRNKGHFSRSSCSQSGYSRRHLIIGRTRVRPGSSSGNPKMLTFGFSGALAGSAISFGSAPFELVKVWLLFQVTEFQTVLMTSTRFCPTTPVGPTSARVLHRRCEGYPYFPGSWHSRRRPRHHEDPRAVWAVHRI